MRSRKLSVLLCIAMIFTGLFPVAAFAADTSDTEDTSFTPQPQTSYAAEFINKCEDQQWFIDEVERLLNKEQKTLDTIESSSDLDVIKAIGLQDHEITGKIPEAIGELRELRYLFLSGNELS